MISLVRPKAMMPVHGEFRMLAAHARLAEEGGVPPEAIVLAENGTVVELTPAGARIVGEVDRVSPSSTASASATCTTSRYATGAICPRTAS
jgi:mRNA degradation ribonuclease J1/J2